MRRPLGPLLAALALGALALGPRLPAAAEKAEGSGGKLRAVPPCRAETPPIAADEVDATLLLVGDAGAPKKDEEGGEPVLAALTREAALDPARTTVVFLGDNVYPRGLVAEGTPERAESERRLAKQLDVSRSGARLVFVPGNHDWDRSGPDGWNAVRRETAFVAAYAAREGVAASVLPANGCPGPEVVDLGATLRIVLLDTEWWLSERPKPDAPASGCATWNEAGVTAALSQALVHAGSRHVAVLAHHPLASGGPHGGHFTVKDHVFPLTNVVPWLWLPLPGVGSAYPMARKGGVSAQDLAAKENRRMRAAIEAALAPAPPLVYASGHDHSLQVLKGSAARTYLVSGAGIFGETSPVHRLRETYFAASQAGFIRLDVARDARVRLGVRLVGKDGDTAEPCSMRLPP